MKVGRSELLFLEDKTMKMSNEGCREQARECASHGDYLQAMRWYNTAYARTIGHKKSDRYEQLARECAEKGGFEYRRTDYAKDVEAEVN